MHVVFRRYRIRLGATEAAARRAQESLLPRIQQIPGFAAYYLVDTGDSTVASIGLFETREGAALGEGLLGGWFREDWPVFQAVPPGLTRGEVLVHDEAPRAAPVAAAASGPRLERRRGIERRFSAERRSSRDRRLVETAIKISAAP